MEKGPTVLILRSESLLINCLVTLLNSKGCEVRVSNSETLLDLEKELDENFLVEADFVIYISHSTFLLKPKSSLAKSDAKKLLLAQRLVSSLKIKGVFLFSYIQKRAVWESTATSVKSLLTKLASSIAIIFIGDLVEDFKGGILGTILAETTKTKKINLPQSFCFYPISCDEASQSIIKEAFSLRAFNARIAILGQPLRVDKLKKLLFKDNYVRSSFFAGSEDLVAAEVDETVFSKVKQNIKQLTKSLDTGMLVIKSPFNKKLLYAFCTLLAVPLFCFFIGIVLVNLSVSSFINAQVTSSGYLASASRRLLTIPNALSDYGLFFNSAPSYMKESEVLVKLTSTLKGAYNLYDSMQENRDISAESCQAIILDLQSAYDSLGFLQSVSTSSRLLDFKKYVFNLNALSRQLPDILGEYANKKYVIVFENPDLLMPGGGKIEKLYLISLHKGQITDTSLLDPREGKNNIAGLVSTPKNYPEFLQDNWYLGSANISSDFPTSAEQLMFFLEKQQDIQVDGVISLNTNLFLDMKTPKGTKDFYSKLYSAFLDLEKNNMQIFFKNQSQEAVIMNLGWGGVVKNPECLNSCYQDILNYFELSLSDQSNVHRENHIQVNIEEKVVKRKVTLYLENKGDSLYRAYLNFLVPENSGFSPVMLLGSKLEVQDDVDIVGFNEFKTLSLFIEVEPFAPKTVVVSWEGELSADQERLGEYVLLLGRQGGLANYKTAVSIQTPDKEVYFQGPDFTLTDMGGLMYNADLSQDKTLRIYFK